MRPDLAIPIALVGVLYVAMGIGWVRGDRDSRLSRMAIRSVKFSFYPIPRDAVYGYIPAGPALVLIALGLLISRHAAIVTLYGAMPLAGLAIALTWRAPEVLKPQWVRAEEASGKRSKRMNRWDRSLTVVAAIGLVVMAVLMTYLLAAGPPASLGW